MERKHEKYERLIERAGALAPLATAVAHPCDQSALPGAVDAALVAQGRREPGEGCCVRRTSWLTRSPF